jgi:thiol-disulfide isomerase/thioredoxin
MDIFLLAALMAVAFIVFMKVRANSAAKGLQGLPAPNTREVDAGESATLKVYFFHATGCRHCKSMMPQVDELRKDHPNLIKVDVSEHRELASQFKLAGTPSFFAVDDGKIRAVKLGMTSEQWLRSHLEARSQNSGIHD